MKTILIIALIIILILAVGVIAYLLRGAYNSPSLIDAGYDKKMEAKETKLSKEEIP